MALPYRPYERRKLEDLLAASRSGLDPDLGYSIFDDVQQGVLDRIAQQRGVRMDRRAVRQEAQSGLAQQVADAALAGVPAAGLDALVSLQAAGNPMLSERGLDALVSQGSALAGSIPGTVGGPPMPIDQDDIDAIEKDVREWATGTVLSVDGNPMSLHDALLQIIGQLRFLGYSAEDQERVRQFVEMKWTQYGGPPRGSMAEVAPRVEGASLPGGTVQPSAPPLVNPYGLPSGRDPGSVYSSPGGDGRSLLDMLSGAFSGPGSTPPLYGPGAPTRGTPWPAYRSPAPAPRTVTGYPYLH